MNSDRAIRLANDEHELSTRCLVALPAILADLDDGIAGLRAVRYDPSTASSRLWCETHERDLDDCEGLGCIGVEDVAPRGDPAGEAALRAAMGSSDTSRRRRIIRLLEQRADFTEKLVRELASAQNRTDTAEERKQTAKANERQDEGCDPCSRVGSWNPPHTKDPTTVDGRLTKPILLCGWHYKFVTAYGELPNEREEADHQAGKRVTRVIRQTDRLRRGLVDGRLT